MEHAEHRDTLPRLAVGVVVIGVGGLVLRKLLHAHAQNVYERQFVGFGSDTIDYHDAVPQAIVSSEYMAPVDRDDEYVFFQAAKTSISH